MHIYKLSICIVILILLSILWYITNRLTEPFRVFKKCEYDHHSMSKDDIALFHELIGTVKNAFDKYNIRYFMVGGTLLGSLRHGGIIPWDDDMDIGLIDTDIELAHKALDELKKGNKITYRFSTDHPGLLKIFSSQNDTFPFIDVFYYKKEGDKYVFSDPTCQRDWPNEWFHESELFPLQKGQFGDFHLNMPFLQIPYLERVFGTAWNTEYKGVHVYKPGANVKLTEGKLTEDMLCFF